MATSIEDTYPGRSEIADVNYPEGSFKNETVTGVSDDGTPVDKVWANDFEGFKQAVMRAAGIVPTAPGNIPDTAIDSQIMKAVIELAAGRATAYDDSGAANAYVLDLRSGQQYAAGLFIGLVVKFTPANDSTGASTLDYNGTVDALVDRTGGALVDGQLVAGIETTVVFDGSDWRLVPGGEVDLRCDLFTHEMTVDADYTLTSDQNRLGRIIVADAAPTLTGPVNIIVATIRRTFFAHNTTAETLTFKTASGTGIAVAPGEARQLLCEGLNVVEPTSTPAAVDVLETKIAGLNTKIIDIGDWDMDTSASATFAHGVVVSKIRTIQCAIRNDSGINTYSLPASSPAATSVDEFIFSSATNITIQRSTSGFFDDASFSATSYNRGWVTIQYID